MSLLLVVSMSVLAVPAAATAGQSVTVSERGSAVKQHKQLVRKEATGKAGLTLPEAAGSFESCTDSGDGHVPLPNSPNSKKCSEYFADDHELVECRCKRMEVDGVAVAVSEQNFEYTCCHKEITNAVAGHHRCYETCVHPNGNAQTAPDATVTATTGGDDATATTGGDDATATTGGDDAAAGGNSLVELITDVALPEAAGSFDNCRASGTNFVQTLPNSKHGKKCTDFAEPGHPGLHLVECLCERRESLGQAIAQNSSNQYEEEYTCCAKDTSNAPAGTDHFDCYSGCVRVAATPAPAAAGST